MGRSFSRLQTLSKTRQDLRWYIDNNRGSKDSSQKIYQVNPCKHVQRIYLKLCTQLEWMSELQGCICLTHLFNIKSLFKFQTEEKLEMRNRNKTPQDMLLDNIWQLSVSKRVYISNRFIFEAIFRTPCTCCITSICSAVCWEEVDAICIS